MKIIFLDIDGPMVPIRAWVLGYKGRHELFDPIAVATLLKILKHDVKLVISSSWRSLGYDEVVTALENSGISRKHLHEDWQTKEFPVSPEDHMFKLRAEEIKEWLSRHPEIEDYVAIDDYPLEMDKLIHVSSNDGISYENQIKLFHALKVRMG